MWQALEQLERLRRRSRVMLITQRLAVVLAGIGLAALVLIAVDYALRLPGTVRFFLLLVGLAGLGTAVWRYVLPAVRFRPTITELALRIEQIMPTLAGRLASSIEFVSGGIDKTNELAARSVRETERRLNAAALSGLTRLSYTLRDLAVFAAVALIAGTSIAWSPTSAKTGVMRLIAPYGSAQWPARTGVASLMDQIVREGDVFPRGRALPLRAQSTKHDDDRVDAQYRLRVDGQWQSWRHIVLTHQGNGVYERLVDTNAQNIEVRFRTADASTEAQQIALVPPPAVRRATLNVRPPAYAAEQLSDWSKELGPGTDNRSMTERPTYVGSEVELTLTLNKPLPIPESNPARREWLSDTFGWSFDGPTAPFTFNVDPNNRARWRLTWQLEQTRDLELTLRDDYALTNDEPISYRISARDDALPQVTVTEPPTDEVVLPTALVSLTSDAHDDIALDFVGLRIARAAHGASAEEQVVVEQGTNAGSASATFEYELDLNELDVSEGDTIVVYGVARDNYALDGEAHPEVTSTPRRLRVISELDFATQLRRELGVVRQNAIRIESRQGELQNAVIDEGVQPGVERAQAEITERLAEQQQAIEQIEQRMRDNRLDDQQMNDLLRQSRDILDFAGQAANRAVEAIEQRRGEQPSDADADDAPERQDDQRDNEDADDRERDGEQAPSSDTDAQSSPQNETDPRDQQTDAEQGFDEEIDEADEPVVEAQQEVREELSDLIQLLDRDEDTWVVTRQLEGLAQQQAQLEQQTEQLSRETIGRDRDDLPAAVRDELDAIAQKQRELRDEARDLQEEMRRRSESMRDVDERAAEAMRRAAEQAEQRELDRDMQQAGEQIERNQLRNAQDAQQQAGETLERMLREMQDMRRAQTEQLLRELATMIESIERLITVQENEIAALAQARANDDFTGRGRAMIRLRQNTQSVSVEARRQPQTGRVARSVDRAADAQAEAITSLREKPVAVEQADQAEQHSLAKLNEALELAQQMQQQAQQQQIRQQRQELIDQYRTYAEQQIALRDETESLDGDEMDRRALVKARTLSNEQDRLRVDLQHLHDESDAIAESLVFDHAHQLIDRSAKQATEQLREGNVGAQVTDHQQFVADSIGRLIEALEDSMAPPDEFARNEQNQGGGQSGGGGQQQQQVVPPIAQLKLLRGLQEQIYNQTQNLDTRNDLEPGTRRTRLRELGRRQRDLMDIGRDMIEQLQQQQQRAPDNQGRPEPQ